MKYQEYNINEKLFGKEYLIYDWKESEQEHHIYVKSQCHIKRCPVCGKDSDSFHATYRRTIQTIPTNGKTTYAHVTAYKYNCVNPSCHLKVFMEPLPFAAPFQVRTTELNLLILAVSVFLSNEGASNILKLMGIKVSNDAIKRIYDSILIEDASDVEGIGIDDVAIRKGHYYATAIYDLKTHQILALLEGRDYATVKNWLQTHKKIKMVTRDRASAYALAISDVLPDCIQVADRFHLLQNLIEKMKDIFVRELPQKIYIKGSCILEEAPAEIKKLKIASDSALIMEYTYDNGIPTDPFGNPIKYDDRSHNPTRNRDMEYQKNRKKNSS